MYAVCSVTLEYMQKNPQKLPRWETVSKPNRNRSNRQKTTPPTHTEDRSFSCSGTAKSGWDNRNKRKIQDLK